MSVKALFTLDDQLLRAAARNKAISAEALAEKSDEEKRTLQADLKGRDELVFSSLQGGVATPLSAALPVLYWIDRSLRSGMVDSLTKLNPLLAPDPLVHAYSLSAISTEDRFQAVDQMQQCLAGFSVSGQCVKAGIIGEEPPLMHSLYGKFGYACLFIDQPVSKRQMALGLRVMPEAGHIFDASFGLLETPTPRDLGNLLSCWLEDIRSPWIGAHYQLWRVTL